MSVSINLFQNRKQCFVAVTGIGKTSHLQMIIKNLPVTYRWLSKISSYSASQGWICHNYSLGESPSSIRDNVTGSGGGSFLDLAVRV